MPRISEFYGIAIEMYFNEHGPPHFHAVYGGDRAAIAIENLAVLEGRIRRRALRLVREWARLHQAELRANWRRARAGRPLIRIEPLS